MSNYSLLSKALLILLVGTVMGCTSRNKSEQPSTMTDYEKVVSGADSVEVTRLVNSFFEYIESGKPSEAAAMLYKVNPDEPNLAPMELSNDELQRAFRMLSQFPIVGHRIDYIKFYQAHENEVKCTAIIAEATEEASDISTVFYLKPIDHLGMWYLCMMDSMTGNGAIVKPEDRDSLTDIFNN